MLAPVLDRGRPYPVIPALSRNPGICGYRAFLPDEVLDSRFRGNDWDEVTVSINLSKGVELIVRP